MIGMQVLATAVVRTCTYVSVIVDISDCNDGDIRLISVGNLLEGRVEVCHDGVWGTVCSNGWEQPEAVVACRQLGYSRSGFTSIITVTI